MVVKIYLIRHGETTGDVEDRYGGAYDDHLSEKEKAQARELAGKARLSLATAVLPFLRKRGKK